MSFWNILAGMVLGGGGVGFVWWRWGAKAPTVVADIKQEASAAEAEVKKL
jgi:hypothetical protein